MSRALSAALIVAAVLVMCLCGVFRFFPFEIGPPAPEPGILSLGATDAWQVSGPVATVRVDAVRFADGKASPREVVAEAMYDRHGRILEVADYYEGVETERDTYHYRGRGLLIVADERARSVLVGRTTCRFDPQGRVVELTWYSSDQPGDEPRHVSEHRHYTYNTKTMMCHEDSTDCNGKKYHEDSDYVPGQQWTPTLMGKSGGDREPEVEEGDTVFKSADRLVKERRGTGRARWTYNARRELLDFADTNGSGTVTERDAYTYTYDSHGNWIRRYMKRGVRGTFGAFRMEPYEVAYRAITYFERERRP